LVASCDTGLQGGSSGIPSVTTSQLLGTWKTTRTYSDGDTTVFQITFYADGTWLELRDSYDSSSGSHGYSAYKGTYSLDTSGMLTRVETHSASLTQFALTGTETWWDTPANYIEKAPILIIGNQLYMDPGSFLIAEGTPSGIVGTWSVTYVYPKYDNSTTGTYTPTYYKYVYIFSATGAFSVKIYESPTGVFGLPSEEITGTYTYSNGTLTMTRGSQSYTSKVTIYNGNILIFGDETSPSAAAYIKQ